MHEDSKSGTSDVLMLLGNHSGPHQRDVAREMLPSAFYTNSQLLATSNYSNPQHTNAEPEFAVPVAVFPNRSTVHSHM